MLSHTLEERRKAREASVDAHSPSTALDLALMLGTPGSFPCPHDAKKTHKAASVRGPST